jgi:hypothetical protein
MQPEPIELASATTLRLLPDLITLHLQGPVIKAILEWFLSLSIRPALRTVRLYDIVGGDLTTLHRFIGALGSDLESLTLSADLDCN